MARRPNYGFEKRQKEMERQRKKEAKAERKRLRKEGSEVEGEDGTLPGEGEDDGDRGEG